MQIFRFESSFLVITIFNIFSIVHFSNIKVDDFTSLWLRINVADTAVVICCSTD